MKPSQCILAYTSLYVDPNGSIRPCCISGQFEDDLKFDDKQTIDELFNSEQFKKLRSDMDSGVIPRNCDVCFKQGNTLKDNWNKMWGHKFDDKTLINEDYTVNRLEYLDVRFSNLCNFKCRMCGPSLSSSWYDDIEELYGKGANKQNTKILKIGEDPVNKFTDDDLKHIRHLYLAGGEPFINDDVFKLLDRFTEEQSKEINMYINTNLSTLKYKDRDVLETLKKFNNVIIGCSCDGYGKVGEFQRTGFISDKFFDNIGKIVEFTKTYKNVYAEIEYTITMMNIFHIFDFIEYVTSNNYLKEDKIHFHWATTPYYFAVAAAPNDFKEKVINYIDENLNKKEYCDEIVNVMNTFKNYVRIDSSAIKLDNHKNDLKSHMMKLDVMRNTNYKEICPWIEVMFQNENLI
jgi:sulfatase maturation enzyme AslB (radical SAM superfamily)